jgi:hypothetical protein
MGYYGPVGGWGGGSGWSGGGGRGVSSEPVTIRLISDPEDAQVHVDGRLVGVVGEFDDVAQRLRLTPGSHEIVIRKSGYVSHRIVLYAEEGDDIKIRHFLEKGSGETSESVGQAPPRRPRSVETPAAPVVAPAEPERPREQEEAEVEDDAATLTVNVVPSDASVYVDGRFQGTSTDVDELELLPGPHTVEVVRPGYRSIELQVRLERGKDKSVDVRLEKP